MFHIIDQSSRQDFAAELREARKLRHRVFVEERGWEALRRADGEEVDQFDTDQAVEMVVTAAGAVVGYQRLLPTTSPYLLTDVFPQLCDGEPPRSPEVWEWTRFAVDAKHRVGPAATAISLELTIGLVRWGLASGVSSVVVEIEPVHLLRFVSSHFVVRPLGLPHRIEGEDVVAAVASFDRRTLDRLIAMRAQRPSRDLFDRKRR